MTVAGVTIVTQLLTSGEKVRRWRVIVHAAHGDRSVRPSSRGRDRGRVENKRKQTSGKD